MRLRATFKYFFIFILFALHFAIISGINYAFPSYDVTTVIAGDVRRVDKDGVISTSNPADGEVRDVYYLYTSNDKTEKAMQYRNENTGWGLPFYFKFNAGEVQAKALAYAEKKQLVEIKYYGWNIPMLNEERKLVSIEPMAENQSKSLPMVSYILYAIFVFTFLLGVQFIRGWHDSKK